MTFAPAKWKGNESVKLKAKCKFCKKELTLSIDDSYDGIGDPMKLLPMATCNTCADLKERQRRIVDRLGTVAAQIIADSKNTKISELRTRLDLNLKDYLRFVAEWLRVPYVEYDEVLTDEAMAKPQDLSRVIDRMWQTCRNRKAEPVDLL